jgi:hypothetical protein
MQLAGEEDETPAEKAEVVCAAVHLALKVLISLAATSVLLEL